MSVFERSESIGNVVKALTQVQSKIRGAKKDAKNPHFRSDYATLESVLEAVRVPLAEAKLAVIQPVADDGDRVFVSTLIIHESGEFIGCRVPCVFEKRTMQAIGSAITYSRRYGLKSMLAIADMDDDGEQAVGRVEVEASEPLHSSPEERMGVCSQAQAKMVYAKAKAKKIPDDKLKDILIQVAGVRSTKELPWGDMNKVLNEIASYRTN